MKIPITFKVSHSVGTNQVTNWLLARNMFERVAYDWIAGELSFEDEDDALAFSITFGATRHETTVERMLKNEENVHE